MQLRERLAYAGLGTRAARPEPKHLRLPEGFKTGENRLGAVHYRDQFWSLDHEHGNFGLGAALEPDPVMMARLAPEVGAAGLRDAAFLDIETTGLSGGTGTYAFLVGLGTFDAFSFRVRQFFLADPSGEAAMLLELREALERCAVLVTYNGKTFDLPQLATRFALSRLPPPATDLPHIDLLHPSRRLFGGRFESCRLAEIEREVLGLRRTGDIPSWMIPGLYFTFIRRGDIGGLHPVFEHNTLDVLSLAGLIAALNTVAGETAEGDAAHLLALARWDEQRGRMTEAAELYERAWRLDRHTDVGGQAVWRLARLVRRQGDWRAAASIWREEAAGTTSRVRLIRAKVELAKVAEHRERDPAGALALAREARRALISERTLERMLPKTSAALAQRLARLERKVSARRG